VVGGAKVSIIIVGGVDASPCPQREEEEDDQLHVDDE
jgi:hypothetical protein